MPSQQGCIIIKHGILSAIYYNAAIPLLFILSLALHPINASGIYCLYEKENFCRRSSCSVNLTDISSVVLPTENFTIQLCSEDYQLDYVITIANRSSVKLEGKPTRLICNLSSHTGIHIYNVTDLVLQDIELISCGNIYSAPSDSQAPAKFKTSIYIINCTDVIIQRLAVNRSKGNGITMFDNGGTVMVLNCTVNHNRDDHSEDQYLKPSGSGLFIVLSYCGPRYSKLDTKCHTGIENSIIHSHYHINHCNFTQNSAGYNNSKGTEDSIPLEAEIAEGFGRGGGLCIVTDKNATGNLIQVTDCNFYENSALWGGALYIAIEEKSHGNIVDIMNCMFYKNTCYHAGGGVDVGYQAYNHNHPQNNMVTLQGCTFLENKAKIGGGVSFYSSPSGKLSNGITFKSCNWTRNEAEIGAAVDIATQVWKMFIYDMNIKITFRNSVFTSNHLTKSNKTYNSYKKGRGTFLAVGYHILFDGSLTFDANQDSAMYLTSTEIEFASNSSIYFTNNKGFEGGAIYLLGFSTITVNDDSEFTFINNSAINAGGAIFQYTYDKREFFVSKSCFILYKGVKRVTERNITFYFQNNRAGQYERNSTELGRYGHSIYAITIIPCYDSKNCTEKSQRHPFNCIAEFIFENESDYDISTFEKEIKIDSKKPTWVIPGKLFQLPIETLNDLSEEVAAVYHASVSNLNNSRVKLDNANTYLSNKLIRLYGRPGDKANLMLETISNRELVFTLRINIQQCPPGYIFNKDVNKLKCECSAQTKKRFSGIRSCDDDNFTALLIPGYWMGYDKKQLRRGKAFGKEKDLLHGICPRGQCLDEKQKKQMPHSLPENTSLSALDDIVCNHTRTGVLCSKCRAGYASHYHDDTYACKQIKNNCRWGWLLYLISEIIPVTIFFIAVMVLNINFTDGAVIGFILFVQISDTMLIRGNGDISFPHHANVGLEAYRFVTRIYNLNFFAIDSLSFCLWRRATTLNLLAFKYITILYSSTLVVVIIAVLKYCHSKRINNILVKLKGGNAASTKATIIHGISGFLVICYSECTRISLLLLTPSRLYAYSETGNYVKRVVPFYNGELAFFAGKHLFYALPALLILIILGIFPPLLLISYPLCYKVLSFFKISETKFTKLLCTCIPLEKLKPFFDSFQSSYKDKYRFFSGLYILYRLTMLATYAFTDDLNTFYTSVQFQLAGILTVHALCQPYKRRWHNIVDALLFMNLSVINAITSYNYHLTLNLTDEQNKINIASTLQVILLYLPLFYITLYLIKKMIYLFKLRKSSLLNKHKCKKITISELTAYHEISGSFSLNAAENRLRDDKQF